ncbi:sensor domain-containing diguanylate cyclase [soil metagenome]
MHVRLPEDEHARIHSLASMARVLGPSNELPRLLEMAAEEALGALCAASVSVSRLTDDGLVVRTIVNVGDLGPDEERWPLDETYVMSEFADLDLSADQSVSWAWDVEDPQIAAVERQLLMDLDKGSSLSAPIVVDGKLWGEVYATRHRGEQPFNRDDIGYLEALLAILAGAISRATRELSLTALAFQDPLTGLANRRALDAAATAAFAVPPGLEREVVVVVVDINRLKAVNDSYGHDAGDRLIRSVSVSLLETFARFPESVVARVGGDEFTVLVTGRPLAEVVAAADAVCARHSRASGPSELSCGAAGILLAGHSRASPTQLFAAADRAQYAAKRTGLCRTEVAGDLEPAPPA